MIPSVWKAEIAFTTINSTSVLVCLLAAILVFVLKLHRRLVYRLALYQVLASLFFAMAEMLQIIFINYNQNPDVYGRLCTALGWFVMYTRWGKLLFTAWVTLHLFSFAVLHKNPKKLEALYVATSLVVPAVIAVVPLTTSTYGLSPSYSYCYIYVQNSNASRQTMLIERFVLWDAPAMVILLIASLAMVAMVIKIGHLLHYRKIKYEQLSDNDQFWRALKELLPLSAFPDLFLIFVIPTLTFHIYLTQGSPEDTVLAIALVTTSLWSMTSGVTVLLHLSVTRLCGGKHRIQQHKLLINTSTQATGIGVEINYASYTHYEVINSLTVDH